jgi:hypothetical protein
VPVQRQESERSCICVPGARVYILFLSTICQLDVGTFPIVLYCILLLFVRHARSKGNKSNLFTYKSFLKSYLNIL